MLKKLPVLLILFLAFGAAIYLIVNKNNNNLPQAPLSSSPLTLKEEQSKDLPQVEIIAQNLEVPWDMVFLPNGSMLVTERPGRVRLIDQNGKLQDSPVATLENVRQTGESGLHGITLHPDFKENNYIYLYYTYAGEENTLNRVSRFTLTNNKLVEEQIIVDEIPGASNHDGGRIRFGPDGFLYITTGDAQKPTQAQDKNSLAGKILRVTDSGEPAPENPFDNRTFSYGHRNPQGIAWDDKGQLFATEHGRSGVQSGLDELNLIKSGQNYGWPTIEGDEKRNGMVTPLLHSGGSTTWAPGGAAFLKNAIYFTGLRGQTLYKAIVAGDSANLQTYFVEEFGRLRNVIVGPDNMLYIATSNKDGRGLTKDNDDKILRVNPEKL